MSTFKERVKIGSHLIAVARRTLMQTRALTVTEVNAAINWLSALDETDRVVLKAEGCDFREMLDIDKTPQGRTVWVLIHMELILKRSNYLDPPVIPKVFPIQTRCPQCGGIDTHDSSCPRR